MKGLGPLSYAVHCSISVDCLREFKNKMPNVGIKPRGSVAISDFAPFLNDQFGTISHNKCLYGNLVFLAVPATSGFFCTDLCHEDEPAELCRARDDALKGLLRTIRRNIERACPKSLSYREPCVVDARGSILAQSLRQGSMEIATASGNTL
ncbi:hypothetical protein VNO77_22755 [Canavalia gladiata]|uniref:Uncharacterized protein n=1 Tax=Canavalia gladiata TaxID=3824 RepID=A0AAN9QAW0_CANGL